MTVLNNQKVWFDGYDLSGISNSISLDHGADALDTTVFGNDTRINVGGLKTVGFGLEGFWNADPYDAALFASIGVTGKVITFAASAVPGVTAYLFKPMVGNYSANGEVGGLFGFSLEAGTTSPLIRGLLAENQAAADETDAGTARQLGAVATGKKIYAGLHVLSVGGTSTPTLDLVINSDATNSFSGAETERIAFDPVTAIGSQFKELSGPITDAWWQPSFEISGTDPLFNFILSIGIR